MRLRYLGLLIIFTSYCSEKKNQLEQIHQPFSLDRKLADLNLKQDAETQEILNQKMDEVRVNKEAITTSGGNNVRNIPPHDSTADTPEKAYPLDLIILKGEWDYLVDILNLLQSEAEIRPDAYPILFAIVYTSYGRSRFKRQLLNVLLLCGVSGGRKDLIPEDGVVVALIFAKVIQNTYSSSLRSMGTLFSLWANRDVEHLVSILGSLKLVVYDTNFQPHWTWLLKKDAFTTLDFF